MDEASALFRKLIFPRLQHSPPEKLSFGAVFKFKLLKIAFFSSFAFENKPMDDIVFPKM